MVIMLVATIVSLCSVSTNVPTASAQGAKVIVGDLVLQDGRGTVEVWLQGFAGLTSAELWLYFDESIAKFISAQDGQSIPGTYVLSHPASNEVRCIWATGAEPPFSGTALWFVITFEAANEGGPSDFRHNSDESCFNPSIEPQYEFGFLTVLESFAPQKDKGVDSRDSGVVDYADGPVLDNGSDSVSPSLAWSSTDSKDATLNNPDKPTLVVAPMQVLPNHETTVSAILCNTGEDAATASVALMVDGSIDQTRTISVVPGACEDVIFSVARSHPGTYQVAIDGMSGQFTVLPAVPAPPPPPEGETVPSSESGGISTATILAVVGAMLILIAGLVFFFRRE